MGRREKVRLIREDGTLPLARKCELAGVSRSSLYYGPRPADCRRLALQLLVDRLYMEFPHYGTRRVIASWLDHYNQARPHLALSGRTPAEVYFAGRGEAWRAAA